MAISLLPLERKQRSEWVYDLSNTNRKTLKRIALSARNHPLLYGDVQIHDTLDRDTRSVRLHAMERAIDRWDVDNEYAIRYAHDTVGYAGIWSGWVGVLGCYVTPPMVKIAFMHPHYSELAPYVTPLLDDRLRELAIEQEAFKNSQKAVPKSS
ncbi:TPA: hypothetical protein HA251_03435 [Candidatus Woesearchaeota archaeon]|nr:hypothetical protein [Candidatus Woesearchaeota archaeon]